MHVAEALALRQAGHHPPVLCLTGVPGAAHEEAVRAGVDLAADSVPLVTEIAAAARRPGSPPGCTSRPTPGCPGAARPPADWPGLVAAALAAQAAGTVTIAAVWSHLACADIPGHPSIDAQLGRCSPRPSPSPRRPGARPEVRHLANTPAALTRPDTWFDLVRPGGVVYGPGHAARPAPRAGCAPR